MIDLNIGYLEKEYPSAGFYKDPFADDTDGKACGPELSLDRL